MLSQSASKVCIAAGEACFTAAAKLSLSVCDAGQVCFVALVVVVERSCCFPPVGLDIDPICSLGCSPELAAAEDTIVLVCSMRG